MRKSYHHCCPGLANVSEYDTCDFVDSEAAADKISQLLIDNSLSFDSSVPSRNKNSRQGLRYIKIPDDVNAACSICKTAFDS